MKNPKPLLRVSVIGTVLVALCCFTPILVILLGTVGLAGLTGYLDVVPVVTTALSNQGIRPLSDIKQLHIAVIG